MNVTPTTPSLRIAPRHLWRRLAGAASGLLWLSALLVGEFVIGFGLYGVSDRLLYVALAGPLLVGLVLCYVYWQVTVYLIFVLLFVEGFLRNLVDSPSVLLLKDGLLGIVYARLLVDVVLRRTSSRSIPPLVVPLVAFALMVLVQTLNPNLPSLNQTLVGLRTWLFYIPLYFVARRMLAQERHLRWFVWFLLGCAVPICLLAIYQWKAGYKAYASLGPGFANGTFITWIDQNGGVSNGLVYRPNATFSWTTHFAVFLALVTLLCFGLLVQRAQKRERAAYAACFALLVGTNVVAGQRTVLVLLPPLLAIVFSFGMSARRIFASVAAVLVGVVVLVQFREVATVQRVLDLFTNQDNVIGVRGWFYLGNVWDAVIAAPYGLGTGATGLGSRYVADLPVYFEVPQARVIGDLSILGLLLYMVMLGTTIVSTLQVRAHAARDRRGFIAGVAAAVFGFQLFVVYAGYDLGILALPFWFLSGALSQIPALTNAAPNAAKHASRAPSPIGAVSPSIAAV